MLEIAREKMGKPEYYKYVDRLYNKVTLMHTGESFVIDDAVVPENKPLFLELLRNFILMHPGEYQFSNDYKKFIKQHADRLEAARKIRAKLDRETSTEGDSPEAGGNGIRPQAIYTPGADLPG